MPCPMIHVRQLGIVQSHVEDAVARGARLLAGGKPLAQLGANFFAPTILADVTPLHEGHARRNFWPGAAGVQL